jgi:hypothetical protein
MFRRIARIAPLSFAVTGQLAMTTAVPAEYRTGCLSDDAQPAL